MDKEKIITDLYESVGKTFPVRISYTQDGKVGSFEYDKKWKSGSTNAVEKEDGTIEYKEDYKEESLSASEVKMVEEWIKNNLD